MMRKQLGESKQLIRQSGPADGQLGRTDQTDQTDRTDQLVVGLGGTMTGRYNSPHR